MGIALGLSLLFLSVFFSGQIDDPEEKPLDPAVLKCTIDTLPLSPCTVAILRNTFFLSHATSIQQKAIPIFLQLETSWELSSSPLNLNHLFLRPLLPQWYLLPPPLTFHIWIRNLH